MDRGTRRGGGFAVLGTAAVPMGSAVFKIFAPLNVIQPKYTVISEGKHHPQEYKEFQNQLETLDEPSSLTLKEIIIEEIKYT